jgi:hypothetical protein
MSTRRLVITKVMRRSKKEDGGWRMADDTCQTKEASHAQGLMTFEGIMDVQTEKIKRAVISTKFTWWKTGEVTNPQECAGTKNDRNE